MNMADFFNEKLLIRVQNTSTKSQRLLKEGILAKSLVKGLLICLQKLKYVLINQYLGYFDKIRPKPSSYPFFDK